MYIKTGMMLDQLTSVGAIDFHSMLWLFALGLIALLPTFLIKKDEKDDLSGQNDHKMTELSQTRY